MKLVIQKGEAKDAEPMAVIERASFSDPWSVESFRGMLALPAAHCLCAWDAEADTPVLIGYLILLAIAPEVEIANLAVTSSCRGQGVGRALMEQGFRLMREKGCDRFFLEVRESNSAARTLYERLGFVQTGRRKRYYQNPAEDALLMALLPDEADI